ncbi:arylsulfatase J-like [Melitaea cinxia]|uniref:arylsulfatase J-like n=1 Tax=Melitaea cinxia TaxID=113334 RepID=UPI001E271B4E|nr:arylsulfatase J-like [Melitaea cinxia]
MYFVANKITVDLKLPPLKVLIGDEAYELLSTSTSPRKPSELSYKEAFDILQKHLPPKPSEMAERYRFDSHIGFWAGKIDMYDHTNQEQGYWGFDFRRGFLAAHDLFGQYATDIYTNEAVKIINSHNNNDPLFLMVSHSAVHSGNPNEPIRAPESLLANFTQIKNFQRQKFAAVLSKLDESVGKVVEALQNRGLLENSIIVFTTDNGGPAAGFNDNCASNYPLRGVKNTLWEGGVRGAGLLWSPLIEKRARVATQMFHLVDWLPTLLHIAGMNISAIQDIDGIDQWEALSKDLKSERVSVLHNIDDIFGSAALTVDKWKLHKGTNYKGAWDSWYGPSGREGRYDSRAVNNARAARAVSALGLMPDSDTILKLRKEATVVCNNNNQIPCNPLKAPCLFDIEQDPCETRNLADSEPEILRNMLNQLEKINRTAVPPNNKPLDSRGNPKFWGHLITNFGDYSNSYADTLC